MTAGYGTDLMVSEHHPIEHHQRDGTRKSFGLKFQKLTNRFGKKEPGLFQKQLAYI